MRSDDLKTALKILATIAGAMVLCGVLIAGAVFASTLYI